MATAMNSGPPGLVMDPRSQGLAESREAIEIGRDTLMTLSRQGETLLAAQSTSRDISFDLDLSRRKVRGMTWGGYFANLLSSEPERPKDECVKNERKNVAFDPPLRQRAPAAESSGSFGQNNQLDSTGSSLRFREQDMYLEEQLKNIQEMGDNARAIGLAVAEQNDVLENIDGKVDAVNDQFRDFIRLQGRIHSSVRGSPKLKGVFALQCIPNGRLLQVDGVGVALSMAHSTESPFERHQLWEIWTREDCVFGLKSVFSGRWLGQALLGGLKVSATRFSSWECWDMNLEAGPSGSNLLCCSANFNGGGWIHVGSEGQISVASFSLADKAAAPKWRLLAAS